MLNMNEVNLNAPVVIDKSTASNSVFCFLGEFGYEMISWIPYLLYLKKKVGITLNTISRKGSKPFYYFSDKHFEVDPRFIGDTWGNPEHYIRLMNNNQNVNIIHPGIDFINKKQISVDGAEWENKDIHSFINTNNYLTPDYKHINFKLPFELTKPYVVLNNKYFRQWFHKYKAPINYYDRKELDNIITTLMDFGYSVVYNHFIENTSSDEYFEFDFKSASYNDERFVDLNEYYKSLKLEERNMLQLTLFNDADFVIGTQGGNMYLPAVCGKDLWILMRHGQYIDYIEFAKLYDIQVNVFYEPWHLIETLKSKLINNKYQTDSHIYYDKLYYAITGNTKT